jgi:uncharacterized membrane protein YeaQ/YmgE (transglycosylase-associated protein family)
VHFNLRDNAPQGLGAGLRAAGPWLCWWLGKCAGGKPMINIIGAIVSGLFVGALARWFYPGAVDMGWLATIGLGLGGSLLAGLITSRGDKQFSRAGCLASLLGAIALIFLGRLVGIG